MPDLGLLPAFVLATTLLMLLPGPNVALIVANSVAYGARWGVLTVLATTSAGVGQLLLVGLGMAELLGHAGDWLGWVRWLGAAYLVVLGVQQWRAVPRDLSDVPAQPRSARLIFVRAALVSLTNPKTLLFYGAFFPQFVAADRPAGPQLAALAALYVVIALTVDTLWAVGAARARLLLGRHARLRNRVSGGVLIGAGVGLAVARGK